ncbi:serine/threonine-protein kinase PLK1-like [Artemia franciscana]|uniref:serine/threonine-protein kinase PLK1-like n=1 Tax=Artemia franciscana TaxID=6661 RepID=UPI0032DA21E8
MGSLKRRKDSSWMKMKDPLANLSMDSGVAGLIRIDKHDATQAVSSGSSTNNTVATLSKSEGELPQYIVDRSTRTTYLKGKFLGKGGFARVHELTDLSTGHVYAGKIIPKSRITKEHHREKIAREVELHRDLIHRHVVRFYRCFEDDENVYIILENCPRKSLVHVMKHRQTLLESEVRYYLRQLLEGLRYIHAAGIIHRDLKLGNMFLSDSMDVKIGDFGLAAKYETETAKVTICGTPNYIAPEVLAKRGHGYEADIWAVGCIMYAMLIGQPPFETVSLSETYARIASNKYAIPNHISSRAKSLMKKMLAPEPRQRPTIDQILNHDFFASGYIPLSLPPSCCHRQPKFVLAPSTRPESPCSSIKSDGSKSGAVKLSSSRIIVKDLSGPNADLVQILARKHSLRDSCKSSRQGSPERVSKSARETPEKSPFSALKEKIKGNFCPDKAKVMTASSLHNILEACLVKAPKVSFNPRPIQVSPLFVSKWIDYSNKYGFGFQLSDRSVGVLFNDSTRMILSSDLQRTDYQDKFGHGKIFPPDAVPWSCQEKSVLLNYFAQYMDENLTEGGDVLQNKLSKRQLVHMKRWVRTPKAIIMQLDNGTLQVNFFRDHTKVIIRSGSSESDPFITYINSIRQYSTYRLIDVRQNSCYIQLRERLNFALAVLKEFTELDGERL